MPYATASCSAASAASPSRTRYGRVAFSHARGPFGLGRERSRAERPGATGRSWEFSSATTRRARPTRRRTRRVPRAAASDRMETPHITSAATSHRRSAEPRVIELPRPRDADYYNALSSCRRPAGDRRIGPWPRSRRTASSGSRSSPTRRSTSSTRGRCRTRSTRSPSRAARAATSGTTTASATSTSRRSSSTSRSGTSTRSSSPRSRSRPTRSARSGRRWRRSRARRSRGCSRR